MKYRYLGNSGLAVSNICIGTMTFGQEDWGSSSKVSKEILDAFIDLGGNFIDTSNHYTEGCSERIIGEWLKSKNRDQIVLSTKCGFKTGTDLNSRGLSYKNIITSCESSLKRLQTDYIDVFNIYAVDPQTPIEETLHALNQLFIQGKIRYYGISNFPAWQITRFSLTSKINNILKPIAGQYLYNLLKRDVETEIIPALNDSKIGMVCWSPLSGGMLTGKYDSPEYIPEDTRLSIRTDISTGRYKSWFEKSSHIIKELKEISNNEGVNVSTVALSWLLKNERVSSLIVGARNVKQLKENCIASEWLLNNANFEKLNELSKIDNGYPNNWCFEQMKNWYNDIK